MRGRRHGFMDETHMLVFPRRQMYHSQLVAVSIVPLADKGNIRCYSPRELLGPCYWTAISGKVNVVCSHHYDDSTILAVYQLLYVSDELG